MEYEEILSKFKIYRSSGNQAKCICPSHNDKQASLSVCYNPSAKRTLIYCQAGCETTDVLQKVNLSITDLCDGITHIDEEGFNLIKNDLKENLKDFKEEDTNSALNSETKAESEYLSLNKEVFKLLREQLKEQNLIIHELNERLKEEQNLNQSIQSLLKEKPKEINPLEEHFNDLDAKLVNIRVQMEEKEEMENNTPRFFKRIFKTENNESNYKYKK